MATKEAIKKQNMEDLYQYRQYLRKNPQLTYLFVELTDQCNLSCMHCGSKCSSKKRVSYRYRTSVKNIGNCSTGF